LDAKEAAAAAAAAAAATAAAAAAAAAAPAPAAVAVADAAAAQEGQPLKRRRTVPPPSPPPPPPPPPKSKTSRFRGVAKSGSRWYAQIHHGGKNFSLGLHDEEEGAARAFDAKARKLGVEERFLNFPVGLPPREGPPPDRRSRMRLGASGFRGVSLKKDGRFLACFRGPDRTVSSLHDSAEEAALAFDKWARKAGLGEEMVNYPRGGLPSAELEAEEADLVAWLAGGGAGRA